MFVLLIPIPVMAANILINEIAWMGTEASGNDEWLELFNNSTGEINLGGWKIEANDGSPKINLDGIIPANGYFLLERTDDDSVPDILADQFYTGSLSNAGEWLKLYDADNNLIDEINAATDNGWPGGDNDTKQTLERTDGTSWQTSLEPGGTPKSANSITNLTEEPIMKNEDETNNPNLTTETMIDSSVEKKDIVINEIFSNPLGIDINGEEFIEIKNNSRKIIDITGWKIKNYGKQEYILPSFILTPNSIIIFYRTKTNLALRNDQEKITLYSTSNRIIDQVEYKSLAPENQSYQRNNDGQYFWAEISPKKENDFKNITLPTALISGPTAANVGEIITFDASDSFDLENRKLKFSWDFGNGRIAQGIFGRQIYLKPDTYEIILTASADESASSTTKLKIKISGPETIPTEPTTTTATSTPVVTDNNFTIPFIFISEFLPNPSGSDDEGEFIEIFSQNDTLVNLGGWQIDDADGGSKPYIIPANTIIKPGQYLAFFRPETKIALNNSDEAVRLFAPDGTMIDYTDYETSKEGVSFVLDEQFNWQLSQTPTPNEINILDIVEDENKNEEEDENSTKPVGKVLGVVTKDMVINSEPKNKTKYLVSGISALMILGIGGILKIKKKF